MKIEQTGFLEKPYEHSDDFFGGVSRIINDVKLMPGGQWHAYTSTEEWQYGVWTSTQACASFSYTSQYEFQFMRWIDDLRYRIKTNGYYLQEEINALEFLQDGRYFDKNGKINFSDRFTAKMSGTTKKGNYFSSVAHSGRWDGLVPESDWLFDRSKEGKVTWNEYYKEIPLWIKEKGKRFAKIFNLSYEWVDPNVNSIIKALEYAPIQVALEYRSKEDAEGIINWINDGKVTALHAEVIYGYQDGRFLNFWDSLTKQKKKYAWNYPIRAAMKHSLKIKINTPMLKLNNDTFVQEVEQTGEFGLYLIGRILVGDQGSVTRTWLMRTKSFSNKSAMNRKDWLSVPHYRIDKPDELVYSPS